MTAWHGPALEIEVTRGPQVESRHLVDMVLVDGSGHTRAVWGDGNGKVFPRSSVKIVQALPVVESGAADAFDLTDAELAVLCASHGGENRHVDAVETVLKRLGLGEADLICGAHAPFFVEAANQIQRDHQQPDKRHNNCSGKHTGMLTFARHMGWDVEDYHLPTHPVQQAIFAAFGDMFEADIKPMDMGFDGCGVPVFAVPLVNIALAAAKVAAPETLSDTRRQGILRLRRAVANNPFMVAGSQRFDTEMMEALGPELFCKIGAEGVQFVALPTLKMGLAIKARDGNDRAAHAAVVWALTHLVPEQAIKIPSQWKNQVFRNTTGLDVGMVRMRQEVTFPQGI